MIIYVQTDVKLQIQTGTRMKFKIATGGPEVTEGRSPGGWGGGGPPEISGGKPE